MREPEQVFTITVSQADWNASLKGWRCTPLKIPGVEVADVFVDGNSVDRTCYQVSREYEMIRWHNPPPPRKATISFRLTEALSTRKETILWKKLTALTPIAAALITVTLSYFLLPCPVIPITEVSREPVVFNLFSPVYGECGGVTISGLVEMPAGSKRRLTRLLWDWGDGQSVNGFPPITHRYSQNDKYSAKVVAYVDDNETEGRTILINITTVNPNCPK